MNTPVEDSVRLPVLAKFSLVPANWLFGDRERIEAAIRNAAEKAEREIEAYPMDDPISGLKTTTECIEIIELHMREALGLDRP